MLLHVVSFYQQILKIQLLHEEWSLFSLIIKMSPHEMIKIFENQAY